MIVRRGYTLLEVILALALAVMVMALVAMGIDIHTSVVTSGRRQVEQAQLARSILNQIADDLRNVVSFQPQDFSSVQSLIQVDNSDPAAGSGSGSGSGSASGSGSGSGTGSGTGGGNQNATGGGTGKTSGSGSGSSGASSSGGSSTGSSSGSGSGSGAGSGSGTSTEEEDVETNDPPLIGDSTWLEVNVSRVPRVDQYERMMSADGSAGDVPSDIKTVSYSLGEIPEGLTSAVEQETAIRGSGGAMQGLVRRALDRAITRYAQDNGGSLGPVQASEILATEVVSLQFGYFDGTEWLTDWGISEEKTTPPVAIEIYLTLAAPATASTVQRVTSLLETNDVPLVQMTYRQVVYLPVAQPAPADDSGSTTTGATP